MVVNIVLMHLRKKRVSQIPLDDVGSSTQEQPVRHEYGAEDPRLVGTIEHISIAEALSQLSQGYRTAFLLHDVHGYEHHEIARLQNCSVGNSKAQLHRAVGGYARCSAAKEAEVEAPPAGGRAWPPSD
jgi:RNA polymerase sigma-70 factor (ECF subfamily)